MTSKLNPTLEELGLGLKYSFANAVMTAELRVDIGPHYYFRAHLQSELETYVLYRDFPVVSIDLVLPLEELVPGCFHDENHFPGDPRLPRPIQNWGLHSTAGDQVETITFPRRQLAEVLAKTLDPLTAEVTAAQIHVQVDEAMAWVQERVTAEELLDYDLREAVERRLQLSHDKPVLGLAEVTQVG